MTMASRHKTVTTFKLFHQWFSTEGHMIPESPYNIFGLEWHSHKQNSIFDPQESMRKKNLLQIYLMQETICFVSLTFHIVQPTRLNV